MGPELAGTPQPTKRKAAGEEAVDPAKSTKFYKLKNQGYLPEFIVQLFDKESKNHLSEKYKTSIINNLLEKQTNGQYQMNLQNSTIAEARSQIERKEAARNELGMPKTVFLANHFHGNTALLQQAIDNGEVQVKADDGKE